MKKIIWGVVALVITFIVIWGVTRKSTTLTSSEPIVIGGNFALTGSGASWGENQLKGAQLAIKEINAAGGVLGTQLKLVAEDNKTEPKSSVSAVSKLISFDKVSFLLTGWTSETEPIIPIINQNKLITITVAAGAPGFTKKSQYLLRTWPSDGIAVEALVQDLQRKGIKKAASISTIGPYESSLTAAFNEYAQKAGIITTETVTVIYDTSDFKTHIAKMKKEASEAVFFVMAPGPLERFVKQSRELGLNVPLLFPTDVVTFGLPAQLAPEYIKDVIYATYAPPRQEFVDSFTKEYGIAPGVSADTTYDAVYMVADALRKAGTTEVEKVLQSFDSRDGVSGRIILNEDRDRSGAEVILMTFDGKTAIPIKLK